MLCILFSFVQEGGMEKSLSIQLKISFRSSLSRFLNENFKPGLNSFWCYSWAIFLGLLEIENFLFFLIVLFVFKFFFGVLNCPPRGGGQPCDEIFLVERKFLSKILRFSYFFFVCVGKRSAVCLRLAFQKPEEKYKLRRRRRGSWASTLKLRGGKFSTGFRRVY